MKRRAAACAGGFRPPALTLIENTKLLAGASMRMIVRFMAIVATFGVLVLSNTATTQLIPSAKRAAKVEITKGPSLESARDTWAIITWTSNNPGGSDQHFGLVQFGKSPKELDQTAKSPIRLNQNHSYTVFRVRVTGLQPRTTYYYKVDSMEADGRHDGVQSPVKQFTTD